MREQSAPAIMIGHATRSVSATAVLALPSFVSAGFNVRGASLLLAVWGAIALIYAIERLGTPGSADAGVSAIHAMRGQAGANQLANYANRRNTS